jgi:hypothetical protein
MPLQIGTNLIAVDGVVALLEPGGEAQRRTFACVE